VIKNVPIALILIGVLGLTYGSIGGSRQSDDMDAGPVAIAAADQPINVPVWGGLGSILIGGFLLIRSRKV
jgi:hypothetical protein